MAGFGPRAQPEQERTRDVDAAATVGTWAAQQAYHLGAQQERSRVLDPHAGYDLGHDVGYSADTEHRGFVHAVMAGFEAGADAHRELAQSLHQQEIQQARERAAETQAELEAEPG
jgi:hypothetical protein